MIRTIIGPSIAIGEKPFFKEELSLGLNLSIHTYNPKKDELIVRRAKNLIVTTGIESIRDLIGGTGFRPSHIGLGTGTTAVVAGDTSIETEQFRDEITRRDDLTAGNEFQLFLGLNDGNTFTYTEAGLLQTGFGNGSSGDPATLIARSVFTGVTKNNSVELTLTWTWTLVAS